MNTRLLLAVGGIAGISAALYFTVPHSSIAPRPGSAAPSPLLPGALAQSQPTRPAPPLAATSTITNASANSTPSRAADTVVNPYAAALKEPGKSKRAWDPQFINQFQNAASNAPIQFELTAGVMASGNIKLTQYRGGELVYFSGVLSAPEPGKFFFLTPPVGGKAGKAVGVIEFPGTRTAYRIEPTGQGGDPELWQRRLDEVVCLDMPPVDDAAATNDTANLPPLRPDTTPTYIPAYNSNIVSLQSYPGSPAVLLLDFFGGYTPTWGGILYARPPVSNAQIKDLWKRVAEDYMPFNINVTTDIKVYLAAPAAGRQRCAFTTTPVTAAGVAYIGSWNWGNDTPCWSVYYIGKNGAEVGSHEPGHTLGLGHQGQEIPNGSGGTTHNEYYGGQGSGATGWAPIMGVGYYQPVATWAKGEYQYANNLDDALNHITTQNNNVAYRPDDTGSTLASSRYLDINPNFTASAEGVIERTGDTDAFQFTTSGGQVALVANPVADWSDLAISVTLANAADAIIATNNPQNLLSAGITNTLAAGTYTFRVTGAGRNDPLTTGFSAYASLGYYSITGFVAGARLPTRLSVVEHSTNGTVVGSVPANNIYGSPLAYAILAGNTGATFSIDTNGTLRVANNTLLDYSRLATNTTLAVQFELFVNITNLANPSLTELNRRVVIAVLDANDPPLVVGFTNSILEHSQAGLAVGTVTVRDPDFWQPLSFSIVGGNSSGLFAIDQTGVVSVAGDLNAATQNVYNLLVAVNDNAAVNPLSSTGYVAINVLINPFPFAPGSISYALYDNIGSGTAVSDLTGNARFPADPSSEKQMPTFEGDTDRADSYGAVMRGYLIPPISGSYTFWLATDDNGELWLSTSTNPASMSRIAYLTSWAGPRQWNVSTTQQSSSRSLVAGQAYYIEARMKEGSGGDNIAVAWKGPATANQTNVIAGQYLAPYFVNYLPHATGFTTSVRRDAITGAHLGQVQVTDVNARDHESFTILSGNNDGIFSIDGSGWVRVASELALQGTATSTYTLTVRVTDSGSPPLSATTTVVLNITDPAAIVATSIQREMFNNIGGGTAVSDLTNNARYPGRPDAFVALSSFASAVDVADNYGSRVRAWLTPPATGAYRFFLGSDDNSALRLSTNSSASNTVLIASVPDWTAVNTWTTYPQQISTPINLVAGQHYYIEALQKEGGGGDHVEVAWAGPGIVGTNGLAATNIIAGSFLAPVDINYAPQFTNQVLQVFNTIPNNTVIGNVYAVDSPLDTLNFKLVAGNTNGMFAISPDSGSITVLDSSLITNGTLSSFTLTVQVQDSGCGVQYPLHSSQATVTINVVNPNSVPFVWTGAAGTNNWASSGNWGGVVPGVGARLVFGYPSQPLNVNDTATSLTSVQFTSDGFNLSGTPLTLLSGLTNSVGSSTWGINTTLGAAQTWFNSGGTLTLSGAVTNAGRLLTLVANSDILLTGPISGSAGLNKSGSARLLMQGVHPYTGATVVSAASGTTAALQLTGPNDLDLRNSDLTMNSRMDLGGYHAIIGGLNGTGTIFANDLAPATLTLGANGHIGAFTGLIQDNTAGYDVTLGLVKTGAGSQTLSGNNTFTGGFVVKGGTLVLNGVNGSSPAGRSTLTINSGSTVNATADNQLGNEASGYLTSLNIAGGFFNAWNNNHVNSVTFNAGALGIATGASQVDGLDLRAFKSVNPLVTTLANASTASISSKITLNAPAMFNVADGAAFNDLLISGTIVGPNSLTKAGPGTLALTADCTYTGGTLVSGGVLQLGSGGSSGSVLANITNNSSLVYYRSGTLTQSGVISGPGLLNKSGPGLVTLTAVNTYSGPTMINQGTLALSAAASISNSAIITVQAGATLNVSIVPGGLVVPAAQTLSGNGNVLGSVRIDGTFAPGPSFGGLTFSANLTLAGTNLFEINKTGLLLTNDWATVGGALIYGGALLVTNTGDPLVAGDTFPLFTAASYNGWFSSVTLPPLSFGLHWATNQLAANGVLQVVTPIPPSILPVSLSGTNLQLSFQSEAGVSYVLQQADALTAPVPWAAVSTNNGTGGLLNITAPMDATQPQRFFRLLAY